MFTIQLEDMSHQQQQQSLHLHPNNDEFPSYESATVSPSMTASLDSSSVHPSESSNVSTVVDLNNINHQHPAAHFSAPISVIPHKRLGISKSVARRLIFDTTTTSSNNNNNNNTNPASSLSQMTTTVSRQPRKLISHHLSSLNPQYIKANSSPLTSSLHSPSLPPSLSPTLSPMSPYRSAGQPYQPCRSLFTPSLPSSPVCLPIPDFSSHDLALHHSPLRVDSRPWPPEKPDRRAKRRREEDQEMQAGRTLWSINKKDQQNDSNSIYEPQSQPPLSIQQQQQESGDETEDEDDMEDMPLPSPLSLSLLSSPSSSPADLHSLSSEPIDNNQTSFRASDFIWEQRLGEGSFSEVWAVRKRVSEENRDSITTVSANSESRHSCAAFAIKKSKRAYRNLREMKRMRQQLGYLTRLRQPTPASTALVKDLTAPHWHPHILRHYAVWQEKGLVYMQTELCAAGDLTRYFQSQRSAADVWRLIKEIGSALRHLEYLGLLHFDVKPNNILITQDDHFVLGDLGSLILIDEWPQEAAGEGDGKYLSPEVLTEGKVSSAVDVYAFGCTLYACVTGLLLKRPAVKTASVISASLTDEPLDFTSPRFPVSDSLKACIQRMTASRVADRYNMDQVLAMAQQHQSSPVLSLKSVGV